MVVPSWDGCQCEQNTRIAERIEELYLVLESIVLALHLIAMGVASAGPLFCMALSWRHKDDASTVVRVAGQLAWISLACLVVGVILGALSLLSVGDDYWDVAGRIPSRGLWFALAELLFSLACLAIYAGFWRSLLNHPWSAHLIALTSVTNLLYHFPPLMFVLRRLASGSWHASSESLDRAALLEQFYRAEIVAPWLHFVLAAVAVAGGMTLWLLARFKGGVDENKPIRVVAGIVFVVSFLQLPAGLWLLTTIPNHVRTALLGNSVHASLSFLLAMLALFLLLGRLAKIALGEFEGKDLRISATLVCLVVLLMATSTRTSREPSVATAATAPPSLAEKHTSAELTVVTNFP